MSDVRYRKVALADIPVLAALRREGEGGGASEDRMTRYLLGTHHPQHALMPRIMFMATADDSPIAYIAGHLTQRFECDGELQWIYVVHEHRGTQVASEMLRLLAQWLVGEGALRVCVDVGNEHAGRFYRRHGAVDLRKHWMVWDDISVVLE